MGKEKIMVEKFEKKEVSIRRDKYNQCRIRWKSELSKYQAVADAVSALGIEPTKELILQAKGNNLEGIKKAYENSLEGTTVGDIKKYFQEKKAQSEKVEERDFNVIDTKAEEPFTLENKGVEVYKYTNEFHPLKQAVEKLNNVKGHIVDLDYVIGPAMDPEYITVEEGKVYVSEETFKQIVNKHFTIRANTKQQLEAYEKALEVQDKVNALMQTLWKNDDERNQAEFADLFSFDETGQYQFDPTTLEHF